MESNTSSNSDVHYSIDNWTNHTGNQEAILVKHEDKK